MGKVWVLLLAIALQCTGVANAADILAPCKLPGVTRAAKCGTVEVPENWDKPAGRKLSIAVAVIPAEVPESHNDPLRWKLVAAGSEEHFGPDGCNGYDMLREPYARIFAELYNKPVTAGS